MKITRISTAVVEANFHWTYVRIYSDCDGGLFGTGECFFAPGLPGIIQEFEGILIGEDFRDIERLVEKMRWAAAGAGSLGGIVWNAITGIEAALWDLKGKALELPVWQLLGGKFRSQIRVYLDCHADGALEALSPLLQPGAPSWDKSAHGQSAAVVSHRLHHARVRRIAAGKTLRRFIWSSRYWDGFSALAQSS